MRCVRLGIADSGFPIRGAIIVHYPSPTKTPAFPVQSSGSLSARHSSASHLGDANVETDQERCTRRKARKEIPQPAAALAEAPGTPTEFEGSPRSGSGSGEQVQHRAIPLQLSAPAPVPDALAHLLAAEDDDAPHLDGLAYAHLTPRLMGGVAGRRGWEKSPPSHAPSQAQKVESKHRTKSKSSAHLVDARLAAAQLPVFPARRARLGRGPLTRRSPTRLSSEPSPAGGRRGGL
ncbi:hypothetical protein B0H14DRAFT_3653060 [Mycena olivaceomarginata]|nr:hypothetical protein B0H14DRAFT_3653060 [Mycena olivaceomarginata]